MSNTISQPLPQAKPPKLLDRLRPKTRLLHYSIRTEEAYVAWVTEYILFHGKQHPKELNAVHVEAFLTHLATTRRLSASTQNQAFAAILFLYQQVLDLPLARIEFLRAKTPERLPVVLSVDEVRLVLGRMIGIHRLMVELLYGSGLRVLECCRLRQSAMPALKAGMMILDTVSNHTYHAHLRVSMAPGTRHPAPGTRRSDSSY